MRSRSNHYEYIVRYVDDLAIVSQNPQEIIDSLKNTYNFKMKGTGPIAYHLGANFERDQDGILCMSPSKYIDRMIEFYLHLFGTKPKTIYSSPLEKETILSLILLLNLILKESKCINQCLVLRNGFSHSADLILQQL